MAKNTSPSAIPSPKLRAGHEWCGAACSSEGRFCDRRCQQSLFNLCHAPINDFTHIHLVGAKLPPQIEFSKKIFESNLARQIIELCERSANPRIAQIAVAVVCGKATLAVADQQQSCVYTLRNSVIQTGCCCWTAIETIHDGYFSIKPRRMLDGSLESLLNSRPAFARENEIFRALGIGPTSRADLRRLGKPIIDEAKLLGEVPSKAEFVAQMSAKPEVWASKAELERLLDTLTEGESRKPGRRPKSRR